MFTILKAFLQIIGIHGFIERENIRLTAVYKYTVSNIGTYLYFYRLVYATFYLGTGKVKFDFGYFGYADSKDTSLFS